MKKNFLPRGLLLFFIIFFPFTAQANNAIDEEIVLVAGTYFNKRVNAERPWFGYRDTFPSPKWKEDHWFDRLDLPEDLKDKAEITSMSCEKFKYPDVNYCAYVGNYQDRNNKKKPLLLSTHTTFVNFIRPVSTLPTYLDQGSLNTVKCNTSPEICIAVGQGILKTNNQLVPFLVTRNSKNWSASESIITNLPKQAESAELTDGSCDNNGCVAVGSYKIGEYALPLIAVSNDLGKIWTYPLDVIEKMPHKNANNIKIKKVACTKNSCIAAGVYEGAENKHLPFVAVSRDKGQTWFYPETILSNMPGGAHAGDMRDLACNSKICTLVGYFDDLKLPLLAISKDNGSTWTYPITLDNEATNGFDLVTCQENRCVATGSKKINGRNYIITSAITKDNGETWTISHTGNINLVPVLKALSCIKDRCFVSGYSLGPGKTPIMFMSQGDSIGKSWVRHDNQLAIDISREDVKILSSTVYMR